MTHYTSTRERTALIATLRALASAAAGTQRRPVAVDFGPHFAACQDAYDAAVDLLSRLDADDDEAADETIEEEAERETLASDWDAEWDRPETQPVQHVTIISEPCRVLIDDRGSEPTPFRVLLDGLVRCEVSDAETAMACANSLLDHVSQRDRPEAV